VSLSGTSGFIQAGTVQVTPTGMNYVVTGLGLKGRASLMKSFNTRQETRVK